MEIGGIISADMAARRNPAEWRIVARSVGVYIVAESDGSGELK